MASLVNSMSENGNTVLMRSIKKLPLTSLRSREQVTVIKGVFICLRIDLIPLTP